MPQYKLVQVIRSRCKKSFRKKCAIFQNWPVHFKPVQNDDQYKFGTNANCAGTKQSVQNVPVQIGQNKVSTSRIMYQNEGKIHQNVGKTEFTCLFLGHFFPASEAATDRHQRPHFSFASGALDNLLNWEAKNSRVLPKLIERVANTFVTSLGLERTWRPPLVLCYRQKKGF